MHFLPDVSFGVWFSVFFFFLFVCFQGVPLALETPDIDIIIRDCVLGKDWEFWLFREVSLSLVAAWWQAL